MSLTSESKASKVTDMCVFLIFTLMMHMHKGLKQPWCCFPSLFSLLLVPQHFLLSSSSYYPFFSLLFGVCLKCVRGNGARLAAACGLLV
uniref:Uncharacterized protein n=1 Tax=Arundo donax TaxID=35708 RepID=A0A0A9PH36_ARUDO